MTSFPGPCNLRPVLRHARFALLLLTFFLPLAGCGASVSGSGTVTLAPTFQIEKAADRVMELDHEDPGVRRRATETLERLGEAALPDLERALVEGAPGVARRAGLLRERILQRLEAAARAENDAFLAAEGSRLAALPHGTWVLVAGGRLAATGASRQAVLVEGEAAFPGARHRYLWRAGDPIAARTVELGALVPGDVGHALAESLGGKPERLSAPEGRTRIPFPGVVLSEWTDEAVALSEGQARVLGLARCEIPGPVTLRSRLGAGVMGLARRARVEVHAASGPPVEAEAWVLPSVPKVLGEEHGRPNMPPVLPPGQAPPPGGNDP